MVEVPSTGQVHGDAAPALPPRSPRGRGPNRPAARSPLFRRGSTAPRARRRTGRTHPMRPPTRPRAHPPLDTASRHESTRFTCPMPTPTEAPSRASRMAFDLTARTAAQANSRSASCVGAGRLRRRPTSSARPGRGRRPPHRGTGRGRPRQRLRISSPSAGSRWFHLEQPDVLLRREDRHGTLLEAGGDHDFGEDLGDLTRHGCAHREVGGDDAAERRHRIASMRPSMRLRDVRPDRDPARVGVFDDRDRGRVEVVRRPPGGVRVDVVVVRHLLAVNLPRAGQAIGLLLVAVQRRPLVRVLPVAQHRRP